jgi:Fuc2NAc and GlcNAc transferase
MRLASLLTLAAVVALVAWAGVAAVRRYAARRLLDLPNDRSSHARPTPRGGGLALTVTHLAALLVTAKYGIAAPDLAIALAGGGLAVALVGILDDHGHVTPWLRLSCHVMAFGWALYWLGRLPPVDFGWGPVDLGWGGSVLLLVYLVWFLNLFNFMDGIDGIAAMQALTMCLAAAAMLYVVDAGSVAALPVVLLGAATAGFLAWNWPPAKIFLGDVGSGYLGYALGTLALWTVVEGWLSPWVWLILGGVFFTDATVTLLIRANARLTLVEAHRSHAYQRLSRHWGSHRTVTLAFTAVNVLWLAPWALVATIWPRFGALWTVAALLPLFVIAKQLGAGRPGEIGDV